MTTIHIAAATHTGSVRHGNEDCHGATSLVASRAEGEVVTAVVKVGAYAWASLSGFNLFGEPGQRVGAKHLEKCFAVIDRPGLPPGHRRR